MKYSHLLSFALLIWVSACKPKESNTATSGNNTEQTDKKQDFKSQRYEESENNPNAMTTDVKIGNKTVAILGRKIGEIKYLSGDGKVNGGVISNFFHTEEELKVTITASAHGDGVYAIYEQTIPIVATKGKTLDLEVKPFEDPEMFSDPATYYVVTVGFKDAHGDYIDVGSTKEYTCHDKSSVSQDNVKGTNRIIPFATQQQADDFVAEIKSILK